MTKDRFTVIEGGEKPKPYRKENPEDVELIICKCGSSTAIETYTGSFYKDGKLHKGTRQLVCFHCGNVLA